MKLTKQQVKQVATLARLGLSETEIEKFQIQLSSILKYVGQLGEVSTDGVPPTAQVTGLVNVTREDTVLPSDGEKGLAAPAELLNCSPLPTERNQIKVKSVF